MPPQRTQDASPGAPKAGPRTAEPPRSAADRYEPLPGITALPGWIWRKLPPAGRIALALLSFLAIVLALLLAPGIDRSKDERARAEQERLARLRAERIERLQAEQRPRTGRGAPAGENVERRAALAAALSGAIEADARRRAAAGELDGPIRSVECEAYPRTAAGDPAHRDPSLATGRYSCLAVTREVVAGERNEAARIGHPYRAEVNFETGRYAFCKVSGRPGEGSIGQQPVVPVPAVCGG
jgi:hypothetical protein